MSTKITTITVKVVDRRWWANAGRRGAERRIPTRRARKPTYVEELEQQMAEKDRQTQEFISKYRQAAASSRKRGCVCAARSRRTSSAPGATILVEMLDVARQSRSGAWTPRARRDRRTALLQGVEMVRRQFLAKLESLRRQADRVRPASRSIRRCTKRSAASRRHHPIRTARRRRRPARLPDRRQVLRPAAVAVGKQEIAQT